MRARHFALAASFAATVVSATPEAAAWYFPEHVVLAKGGIEQLPPALRDVVADALVRARREGLELCPRVVLGLEDLAMRRPLSTRMVRSEVSVDCVPYAALAALAGDHADSASELRVVLATKKGIELVSASAYEWSRFRAALERLPNTSLERMSFVHDLDVDFYFIDPGYELRAQSTRAHFVDAGRSLATTAMNTAVAGAIDNSLGQFLAHHVRSLERAAKGDVSEAILQHAFAIHFLEDAFSAGHLVMTDATWATRGNTGTRARHDYFDAKGLKVGRAMSAEPCRTLGAGLVELGLPPCWTTTGDGWLGVSPDASDRAHVVRALAKAELELAIALDPQRVVATVGAASEREQIALGELVDPAPWWTLAAADRARQSASAARALRLVRGAAIAIAALRDGPTPPPVAIAVPAPANLFDARFVSQAFAPCVARADVGDDLLDDAPPCGPARALALGTVGVSLLRPMLVEWPESQDDPATLHGETHLDHGVALQLLVAGNAGALFPPRAPVDFFAPSVAVSGGVSYRWGTYLPGRRNRALAEANVGISEALHYDSKLHAGGNPHVTMLDQELRWPIAFEIFTSYLLPLDLSKNHDAGTVVFLSGARVHELLTNPKPVFWGLELEVAAIALSRGRGVYPTYVSSPELRFYLGAADPAAANPSLPHHWGPTFGLTFIGGYATFL